MLNMHEMCELYLFQESLPDGREKELLGKLLFDHTRYIRCGTVEECENRKEWMNYSIDDIRTNFNNTVKALRDEVAAIRNEKTVSKKCKGDKNES